MRKEIIFLMLLLGSFLLVTGIFVGCGTFPIEGEIRANIPPSVEWAQVPQDSARHSSNPTLQWLGKDRDGQITALQFQYTVVLEEDVDGYGGAAAMAADFPPELEWDSLGNETSAVIPLFASEDTSVFVDQFVFLRCIDDQGDYSNIIYLFLSRNNHPPTCSVNVPEGPQWCVPDTSDFWGGIGISWEGKDSIDYVGVQPDFIWEARIYGPFETIPDSTDTLDQYLYHVYTDPETGSEMITYTGAAVANLETGWYIFYVKNYDDASVGSIPALGFLQVYEPKWVRHMDEVKQILIVNHSSYTPAPGNYGAAWRDSVSLFYADLMADAGFTENDWDWTDVTIPDISTLYEYRMVIADDIDWNAPITTNPEANYADYLDIGGKIWIMGRYSFANVANQDGIVNYSPNDTHPLAYTYLDLSATVYPVTDFDFAEFTGANPVSGAGLPFITVDSEKLQGLSGSFSTALPRVEHLVRENNAQTLYTFVAEDPGMPGTFHGFPVAIRNENGIFKTSYFSFHLFFLPYNQASTVFNSMISWYLD